MSFARGAAGAPKRTIRVTRMGGWLTVVELELVALVGERTDEAHLATHVATLDEQRRPDDEDVGARGPDEFGRLVDAAIDMDLAAAVCLVAQDLARRQDLPRRATSRMNVWPRTPVRPS